MKKLLKTFIFILALNIIGSNKIYAYDLTEYIARPTFVEHSLSTGERIWFSEEPGAGGVRQYKNDNYEQFFIKDDGYYRREDTSWAPRPGFQDAHCGNGNKAIYALDPNPNGSFPAGTEITSTGAFWAPDEAEVGDIWDTGAHTIVPIDSGEPSGSYDYSLPPLVACKISDPSGYPASVQEGNQVIQFLNHYGRGEFVFCTGVPNPADMIVLRVASGPGYGDTFYFMKGWGLVGFETAGWEAGLSGGPGVTVGEVHPPNCEINDADYFTTVPRTVIGKITSSQIDTDDDGVTRTNKPVEGASVCLYQGGGQGRLPYYISGFEAGGTTDEEGFFSLKTHLRREEDPAGFNSFNNRYNFLGIFCGNDRVSEIIMVDMYALQKEHPPERYMKLWEDLDPRTNNTVLAPIEVTVLCDPKESGASFGEESEDCPYEPGNPHGLERDCVPEEERGFYGWDFKATYHPGVDADNAGKTNGSCPHYLPYTDRRESARINCGGGDPNYAQDHVLDSTDTTVKANFQLAVTDNRYKGEAFEAVPQFSLLSGKGYEFEGKMSALHTADGWPAILANIMTFATGGLPLGPQEIPKNPEGDGMWEIYSCELLREGNKSYNPGMPVNLQNTQGILSLLAPPFTDKQNQLKDMYEKMDRDKVVCCIKDDAENLGLCGPNEDFVRLDQIRPYRYMIDPEDWCVMEPDRSTASGWSPAPGETCGYLYPEEYFPTGLIYRRNLSDISSMDFTREEPIGDSITTDDNYRRDKIAYADDEDKINDVGISGHCPPGDPGAKCGAIEEKKDLAANMNAHGSKEALRALTDTSGLLVDADGEPVQPTIGVMEPYTGFEGKQTAQTYSTGHRILTTQHKCLDPIIDGHKAWPSKIELVGKEGPPEDSVEEGESVPVGGYAAAFDFQGKMCPDPEDGFCPDEDAVETNNMSFYTWKYLNPIRNFLGYIGGLVSKFWGSNEEREDCKQIRFTDTECPTQAPGQPGCEYDEDRGAFYLSTYSFECEDSHSVPVYHQADLNQSITLYTAVRNMELVMESFMVPSYMEATSEMEVAKAVDAQSDAQFTQNNEEGFGGISTTRETDPTNKSDKIRQMVRPYTDSFPDDPGST